MSIPPDSLWRGGAAYFAQPLNEDDERAAQYFVEHVYYFNCYIPDAPLTDIVYRSSSGEEEIRRHVFRWDFTPYWEVFQNGFQVRRQQHTSDQVYFNLEQYVHDGRPLDTRRPTTHAFLSTTLNGNWHPNSDASEIYRYEIYAPGGIWVAQTLGDQYRFPRCNEVCFIGGIAPQYIRSAERFSLVRDGRYARRQRLDHDNDNRPRIILNRNFNPQSHPERLINIRRPVFDYVAEDGLRQPLTITICLNPANICRQRQQAANSSRQIRSIDAGNTTGDCYTGDCYTGDVDNLESYIRWYARDAANCESYIDAAFRSSHINEAYIFMRNEYVRIDYAPGTNDDKILNAVNGPLLIRDGFPSLKGTAFAENGIDCAFGSYDRNEAFIFSGNLCAHINFAPGTTDDKIIHGPMTISAMFPFFKKTVFESGVDAAFESTIEYSAYLFKDDQYALIIYRYGAGHLAHIKHIRDGYPSLRNTIFASGIEAAFASHRNNEAYLFKGDSYALINFAPCSTDDYIIGGVKQIRPNWPSLQSILPRKNRGVDVESDAGPGGPSDDPSNDEF